MNKILSVIKKYKKSFIFGAILIVIILFFVLGGGEKKLESHTVATGTVEESVMLSGKVTTSDKADLGFAASGRVARIMVKNNQSVSQGAALAQLEIGDLLADLRIKELNSTTSEGDLNAAKVELANITAQEDTKVENAYRNMLSDDLELVPESNTYTVEPPTISGAYTGVPGQYKLNIIKDSVGSTNLTLFAFNLERTKKEINNSGTTALGTKGLYIDFPEEVDSYEDTTWYLDIPNKSGASYTANLNAYNGAKNARDLAVKNAEADYQKLLTEQGGGDSVALAEIQKIKAEIRKNTIYAPFPGIVTNIEKEVGENASVGERVISILGEEKLEVVLQVSELDVAKLIPGAKIEITIDAIPGEKFEGTLKTVNSRETEVQGVPVYEAFVELPSDARVKTGMSASGRIILSHKENVLTIPLYAVESEEGKSFVTILLPNNKSEKREVVLGLKGSDSMVEVVSGISLGDKVLFTPSEK